MRGWWGGRGSTSPAGASSSSLAFLATFDEAQGTLIVGAPRITTMLVLTCTLERNYPEPASAAFSIPF